MDHNGKGVDGRILAEENQLDVLYWTHRLGWAKTADLAAVTELSTRSAQYTLKMLRERKEVVQKGLPDGQPGYTLSRAGAFRLRDECDVRAKATTDTLKEVTKGSMQHRELCNSIAIWWHLRTGEPVATERDILARRSPVKGEVRDLGFTKVPDVLLRSNDVWFWVEVERTKKKRKDYNSLLRLVERISYSNLYGMVELAERSDELVERFVLAADHTLIEAHARRLARELCRRGTKFNPNAANDDIAIMSRLGRYHWEPVPLRDYYWDAVAETSL